MSMTVTFYLNFARIEGRMEKLKVTRELTCKVFQTVGGLIVGLD